MMSFCDAIDEGKREGGGGKEVKNSPERGAKPHAGHLIMWE